MVCANGEEETTRTPALEWMCEQSLYKLIQHLNVFSNYRYLLVQELARPLKYLKKVKFYFGLGLSSTLGHLGIYF